MNILIIGCGIMGATLTAALDKAENDLSVVDSNPESFDALPDNFSGFTATGIGIDQDVLMRAGIEACDALFAVTENDDMNLMTAQIASHVYNVPKIFAKVDSVEKCKVFESLGVSIISPTRLSVSAACDMLADDGSEDRELKFGNALIKFSAVELPANYVGCLPEDVGLEEDEALFGIIRENAGFIIYHGQAVAFEAGDRLIFAKKN